MFDPIVISLTPTQVARFRAVRAHPSDPATTAIRVNDAIAILVAVSHDPIALWNAGWHFHLDLDAGQITCRPPSDGSEGLPVADRVGVRGLLPVDVTPAVLN